jgi:hypothetical protein
VYPMQFFQPWQQLGRIHHDDPSVVLAAPARM